MAGETEAEFGNRENAGGQQAAAPSEKENRRSGRRSIIKEKGRVYGGGCALRRERLQ